MVWDQAVAPCHPCPSLVVAEMPHPLSMAERTDIPVFGATGGRTVGGSDQTIGRFSYGVDNTIVVRVDTFAVERILASRVSRSSGRATRTLRM